MNETLKAYWNEHFQNLEPQAIDRSMIDLSNPLNQALKALGDQAEHILDLGTGTGYCLFSAYLSGTRVKTGIGIDPSKNAIEYARKTSAMSDIVGLSFEVGDENDLNRLKDASFDAIICSNVLDVVPFETSEIMIPMIDRLLKQGGLLLLKLNFFLTDELIVKLSMEEIDRNTYRKDGILRAVNMTSEQWIRRFPGYDVIETGYYARIENGPKDRILLLKKAK